MKTNTTLIPFLYRYQLSQLCHDVSNKLRKAIDEYDEIVVICTLKGALPFFNEVIAILENQLYLENSKKRVYQKFIKVSSYTNNEQVTLPFVREAQDDVLLNGRLVIIFDDIVDSGNTVIAIWDWLRNYNPKHHIFVALLSKYDEEHFQNSIHKGQCIFGKVIPKDTGFLVGYGLDDNESLRGLPMIYTKSEK